MKHFIKAKPTQFMEVNITEGNTAIDEDAVKAIVADATTDFLKTTDVGTLQDIEDMFTQAGP